MIKTNKAGFNSVKDYYPYIHLFKNIYIMRNQPYHKKIFSTWILLKVLDK